MKIGLRLLTISLSLIIAFNLKAQDDERLTKNEAEKIEAIADFNFEENNYIGALDKYTQLYNYKPTNLYYKLMMGICYAYDPGQKYKSIEVLEEVKLAKPDYDLCDFYLGKAYAINYKFDKALEFFNMFLANPDNKDEEQKIIAAQLMDNCNNAKRILADTIKENFVENMKYPINSQYSEYTPIVSADGSLMIFAYRGIKSKGAEKVQKSMGSEAYNEDVFISYNKDGVWSDPVSIGEEVNSEAHDAPIALSLDGQTLFIYKTDGGGDIYDSHLSGRHWIRPRKLKGDVNKSGSWEGSCSLSANGKVLYFSSDRAGGFGGKDIYKAELQDDKTWGDVQNLGPTINTELNDDDPFIHPDNVTLYFSSEGHTSIGGYDIFSAKSSGSGSFGTVKNLGYPINTVDDNRYFKSSADGKTGYYSGGGENSLGEQDIFKITAGKVVEPALALLLGKVYFNDIQSGAAMKLYKRPKKSLEGVFRSNLKTGKYVMALTPGVYDIAVKLESGEIVKDSVNLIGITDYVVLNKDFRIYSDSTLIKQNNSELTARINAEAKLDDKTVDTLFTESILEVEDLKAVDKGTSFRIDGINYDFDKSILRADSKLILDSLVAVLNKNPEIKFEISSHTDGYRNIKSAKKSFAARGLRYSKEAHDKKSKTYNNKLSERRAQSVFKYLTQKGINETRLIAKGYGEEKPVATNDTEEGRQLNRRTEFKVLDN